MLGSIITQLVAEEGTYIGRSLSAVSPRLRAGAMGVLLLLALASSVVGCDSSGQTKQETASIGELTEASLDSIHRQETFLLDSSEGERRLYADVSFIYPKDNPILASSLASMILADSLSSDPVEIIVSRFLSHLREDYQSYFSESKGTEEEVELGNGPLVLQIHTRHLYESKAFVSFESSYLMSKGVSDSSRSTLYCCLDRESGRRLTMSDLFVDEAGEELARIQLQALMKQLGVKDTQELENSNWIYASELGLNTNFYLGETHLFFLYNSYDLSPLVAKPIEIRIPYTQIASLARENGPLGWLRSEHTSETSQP